MASAALPIKRAGADFAASHFRTSRLLDITHYRFDAAVGRQNGRQPAWLAELRQYALKAMLQRGYGDILPMKPEVYMEDVMNPADFPKWVLFRSQNGKNPYIVCNGRSLRIPKRLARIISVLLEARLADQRLPGDFKGFRKASEIAAVYDEDPRVDPPLATTITAYLYQLCRLLKNPRENDEPFPALIERVRNCGARLLHSVGSEMFDELASPESSRNDSGNAMPPASNRIAHRRKPKASGNRRAGADSA